MTTGKPIVIHWHIVKEETIKPNLSIRANPKRKFKSTQLLICRTKRTTLITQYNFYYEFS